MATYRKLGRPSDQRRAMLRAMTTYLLENGQIKTTYARAKEVAAMTEKMITLAKKEYPGGLSPGSVLPDEGGCGQEAV